MKQKTGKEMQKASQERKTIDDYYALPDDERVELMCGTDRRGILCNERTDGQSSGMALGVGDDNGSVYREQKRSVQGLYGAL